MLEALKRKVERFWTYTLFLPDLSKAMHTRALLEAIQDYIELFKRLHVAMQPS